MQLFSGPVGSGVSVATLVFLQSPTKLIRMIKITQIKEKEKEIQRETKHKGRRDKNV